MTRALVILAALQTAVPTLPVVTLESIVASPEAYNGQDVIVAARVMRGEGLYIALPSPTAAEDELMWVRLTEEVTMSSRSTDARLVQTLKERPSAVAVLRGRLTWAAGSRVGHLNCCRFMLEVREVLSTS